MDYTNRSHEAVRWNIMAHIDIVIKMGYGGPERDESTFFSFFIFSFFFFLHRKTNLSYQATQLVAENKLFLFISPLSVSLSSSSLARYRFFFGFFCIPDEAE